MVKGMFFTVWGFPRLVLNRSRRAEARAWVVAVSLLIPLATARAEHIIIDGTAGAAYPGAVSVQTIGTGFGNSTLGKLGFANGSELDAAFAVITEETLYLTLTGNLESNFNKLEIFIDSKPGGQNKLQGNNPDVDFNGLNRMGDDGSGNGLTFDAGFEADYYVTATGGNDPYQFFANYAEVMPGGVGLFLGGAGPTPAQIVGPNGITLSINNSNVLGVNTLDNPFDSDPATVLTGIELAIPLSAIGDPAGGVNITAFINGGGHDFASNQWLGSLPAGFGNLADPRFINLAGIDGLQYFNVVPEPATCLVVLAGLGLLARRRR